MMTVQRSILGLILLSFGACTANDAVYSLPTDKDSDAGTERVDSGRRRPSSAPEEVESDEDKDASVGGNDASAPHSRRDGGVSIEHTPIVRDAGTEQEEEEPGTSDPNEATCEDDNEPNESYAEPTSVTMTSGGASGKYGETSGSHVLGDEDWLTAVVDDSFGLTSGVTVRLQNAAGLEQVDAEAITFAAYYLCDDGDWAEVECIDGTSFGNGTACAAELREQEVATNSYEYDRFAMLSPNCPGTIDDSGTLYVYAYSTQPSDECIDYELLVGDVM